MEKNENEKIKEQKDFSVLEYSKQKDKKKRKLKSLALLIFNILVIAVIIIVEFTGDRERVELSTVLATWGENWYYLLALLAVVVIYYLCLAAKISVFIKATTGRFRKKLSFSTAVLGKYYDNITPFGSGGQPFMMFNLGRKLDVGHATSIPVADFIISQFMFIVVALIVFIVNPGVMAGNEFLKIAAYIGLGFYSFIPLVVILFSIFPGVITAIAKFFCRVGHKIKLIKNLEKAENKVTASVSRYASSLKHVSKKWPYLIIVAIISMLSWWALNSMPYMVLRACGVEADYFDTVCMGFFVYAAITVVPTPGNAGAAEGAFYAIFQSLSGGFLFWGTMLWRFCIYYISLIAGFSVTVYQYIHVARKEKRAASSALAASAHAEAGESVPQIELSSEPQIELSSEPQENLPQGEPPLDELPYQDTDTEHP